MFKKLSILLLVLVFIAGFTVTAMATPPIAPTDMEGVYKFKQKIKCRGLDGKLVGIKKESKTLWISLRFIPFLGSTISTTTPPGFFAGNVYKTYDKKANALTDAVTDNTGRNVNHVIYFDGEETFDPTTFATTAEAPTSLANGFMYYSPVVTKGKSSDTFYCDYNLGGRFKGNKPTKYRIVKGWDFEYCYEITVDTTTTPPSYGYFDEQLKCKSKFFMKRKNDLPEDEPTTANVGVRNAAAAGDVQIDGETCGFGTNDETLDQCNADFIRNSMVELTSSAPVNWLGCDDANPNPKSACTVYPTSDTVIDVN